MSFISKLTFVFVILSLTGCSAKLNSIKRDFDTDSGVGALIDAKQRSILVSKRPDTKTSASGSSTTEKKIVVCAEPSPDALSAYAAQLALEGNSVSGKGLALAAGSQETAASIGLRTQSIQLLRDLLYRNCEAYLSGAINEDEYASTLRRSQKNMVTLLAIEQLTGAIKAPNIILTTNGSASTPQNIASILQRKSELEKTNANLKESLSDLSGDAKTKAEETIATNEATIANYGKLIEQNEKSLNTNGGSSGIVVLDSQNARPTGNDLSTVADKIAEMVGTISKTDESGQFCWDFWKHNLHKSQTDINVGLNEYCAAWLTSQKAKWSFDAAIYANEQQALVDTQKGVVRAYNEQLDSSKKVADLKNNIDESKIKINKLTNTKPANSAEKKKLKTALDQEQKKLKAKSDQLVEEQKKLEEKTKTTKEFREDLIRIKPGTGIQNVRGLDGIQAN